MSKLRKMFLFFTAALIIILMYILFNVPKRIVVNPVDVPGTSIIFSKEGISENRDHVEVNGNAVYITGGGQYELKGESPNARIEVNAPDETVELILNAVNITSKESAVINVQAGKLIITTLEGDACILTDSAKSREMNGAIYSKDSITFKGNGTLFVNGKYANAVSSENNINIEEGSYYANASKTGYYAKYSININSGNVTVGDSDRGLDSNKIRIANAVVTINSYNEGIITQGQEAMVTLDVRKLLINSMNGGIISSGIISIDGGDVEIHNAGTGTNGIIQATEKFSIQSGTVVTYDGSATNELSIPVLSTQVNGILYTFPEAISSGVLRVTNASGTAVASTIVNSPIAKIMFISNSLRTWSRYNIDVGGTAIKTFTISESFSKLN